MVLIWRSWNYHNLEKGLLVAGVSVPRLGGEVIEPMRLIFGDRAIYLHKGLRIPVGEIAEAAARRWICKSSAW